MSRATPLTTSHDRKRRFWFINKIPVPRFRTLFSTGNLKSEIRNYALLFFGSLLFHVAGTWSLPLIDRDEPRFAEASREMRERHDYIVPYFNNHYRFDKPPLTYWAQIASYSIFGENDFAARFPSTIAAALTALVIFAWGSRIQSNRLGWWAAIIFTLSLQTFIHAKAAVADMWLVLFVTIGHWAGYEILRDDLTTNGGKHRTPNAERPTSKSEYLCWWFIFYSALAFGFLAKGPIAWTPLLTIATIKLVYRDVGVAQHFKFVRGILLTLAIISLWAIPALMQTHGEFLRVGIGRHVIGRSFGAMEGHGANSWIAYLLLLPFYFVTLFVSFFPWSIKLPGIFRQFWQKREKIDNYLLAGTAVVFLIFTLVKTKLPHYTLPAFPLLALLLARSLVFRATNTLKYWAVGSAVVLAGIALTVPSFLAPLFPARELFNQSRDYLQPEMEFAAVEFNEPSLVWYFRSRVKNFMTILERKDVDSFMARTGPRFAVLPTAAAREIFANPPSDWKTFSTSGFNITKGKRIDLTLILKPM
jgi:4-amino-4-deoxy-L-arabinose transferase-like glycosyltransferase